MHGLKEQFESKVMSKKTSVKTCKTGFPSSDGCERMYEL